MSELCFTICKKFREFIFIIVIIVGSESFSYSQNAQNTPAPLSSVPQPGSDPDTIHFIVYDYSRLVLLTTQPLPIDRPFNLKIIKIPSNIVINSASICLIDPRIKKKSKHPVGLNKEKLDQLEIVRRIMCTPSSAVAAPGEANFVVPKNLWPNRDYCIALGRDTLRKLNNAEKEHLIEFIKSLKKDSLAEKIFNKAVSSYFKNKDLPASTLPDIQNELYARIDFLAQQQFPEFRLHIIDLDSTNVFYDVVDKVRTLKALLEDMRGRAWAKNNFLVNPIPVLEKKLEIVNWFTLDPNELQKIIQNALPINNISFTDTMQFKQDLKAVGIYIQSFSNYLKDQAFVIAANAYANSVYSVVGISPTYFLDITKNAQRNVTIDLGSGYSWSMDKLFLYTAINVYFRPLDKNLPLWNTSFSLWDFIGSRFSLVAGVTLTPVDEPNVRSGIFGNKGIILGGGMRLLPWLKISAGSLIYYGFNKDRLVSTNTTTRFTPFASLSIDIDVKTIFGSFPIISETLFK